MNREKLWKGVTRPRRTAQFLKRKIIWGSRNLIYNSIYQGVDVMEEDWDNLILLDACRYDLFYENNTIKGESGYRISKGSNSPEFISKNFNGKYHDTIYISGNPFLVDIEPKTFHKIISVFDEWDGEVHTIPPDAIKRTALDIYHQYPNKRLIIHFMQPHIPFLGPTGDQIRKEIQKVTSPKGWGHTPPDSDNSKEKIEGVKESFAPTLDGVNIGKEEIRTAYVENLQIVLEHVSELLSEIEGKSVISADHGEHLGEQVWPTSEEVYDHPKVFTTELRKVPWFIPEYDDRREIKPDPPGQNTSVEINERDEKLEALGYK